MKNKVLIFPSGAENALEINEAIKHSVHVEVIPGSGRNDYSELIYENKVRQLPFLNDEDFIPELNELIRKEEIKLIFPTDDTAALELTKHRGNINAQIISADYSTNEICRFKSKTYELFKEDSFCPKVFLTVLDDNEYPIFSKPDVGQGAQGVKIVKCREEHRTLKKDRDTLFVEYLPGKEYTIDCFTDRKGKLLFTGARERAEVKMGISFKSYEFPMTDEIRKIAEKINEKLKFRGLWFFQLKEDTEGRLKLLEVSTRTAGTMGYFRHKGVNLPLFSVFDALGMDVTIQKQDFDVTLFRTTVNKYKYGFTYSHVYLDYDDTVIVNGKVNRDVISFIYQCKNNGVKIHLISKHGHHIHQDLRTFCIDPALFDQIICMALEEKKSDYIIEPDSIFIDNWYRERKEVSEKHGIPCFDVDIVKSLIAN
ncbi:ATP-grasp domain-containing protein [Sphingobacterium sp. SGR-19]|uniref:ATP-grasp domain-containing protein n=1 Tax=Sphingobacterium sp. SGR-19 TaxID=2710886 RepID=UPI0013ED50BE|nr:ATP-grasp domain-containing protein [Sphingobacterium sp. SGR-19]NGM67216.1 ATP-grasp domain-containing protein [Sphingobacterium sp. SGR-19]